MLPSGMDLMMSLPKAITYLSPGGNVQNTPAASSVADHQLPRRLLSPSRRFRIWPQRSVASCQSPSSTANGRAGASWVARNCFNCAEAADLSSDHDDAGCFLEQPTTNNPAGDK